MSYELAISKILITGASSGLGFEMATALLEAGAEVALAARPGEKLDEAVTHLRTLGFKPLVLPMDVRDENSIASAKEKLLEEWGTLDMLVNNAGISLKDINLNPDENDGQFLDIAPDDFRDVVATNFIGYFLVAQAFVPLMIQKGTGRVINVSTSINTMTMKGQIPYGPARAGAEALSDIMAKELKDHGITVNVLLPGGAADTGLVPPEMREIMLPRLLPPNIMNEAILYLASPEAEGITGERFIGKEFWS